MALLLAPHPHTALLRHATPPPRLCYNAPPPQLCYFARTSKLCYFARTPQLSYIAPPPRRALLLCSTSPLLIVLPLLRLSLLDSLSHRRQNNKVKDTNNRNARVIYDAKEVINGLQAPIVKDAEMDNVDKRPGMLRSPKYTNKRVDEVFSARKSKFGVVSGKENAKENPSLEKTTTSNLKNVLVFSTSAAKRQQGSSCMENSATSGEVNNDGILQACQTTAECSQVNFQSVSELFSAADKSSGLTAVDVGKALRGLAAPKPCARTGLAADSTERCGDMISSFAANSISEYHILGRKAPLDLTLKTGQNVRGSQGFKVLHSWMYPQSILPPSLTSVLSSSTADAGDAVALKSVAYSGKMKAEKRSLWSSTASIEKRSLFPNAKSVAIGA
ncbi:hypothetical protein Ahy_A07g036028 [Arachis hypogaea]|uniref:Uncharacterized protein n=1 Tax=Arachis hypogaea TaxID=3818 RepID=A0A445CF19_ARAHY|nr:hypothetical protein Ahy_A07g036028 [Arachis hypogaea]